MRSEESSSTTRGSQGGSSKFGEAGRRQDSASVEAGRQTQPWQHRDLQMVGRSVEAGGHAFRWGQLRGIAPFDCKWNQWSVVVI